MSEERFAVSKYNEKLTIDTERISRLTQNGDYRLVHSTAKAEPSKGLDFAKYAIKRFNDYTEFYDSSMDKPEGTLQNALAELYKKDKKNLRYLIKGLMKYDATQR